MKTRQQAAIAAALLAMALVGQTAAPAAAADGAANNASNNAVEVRSGGVSLEEFAALNREAGQHTLKLLLASKGRGAYLAGVDVTVRDLQTGRVVLQHRTEGPLLLARLPPGRYEVVADYADVRPGAATRQQRNITIGAGLTSLALHFDTVDDLSAETSASPRPTP
jgi:hypothetical protein